jgi:hypothetical protein
MNARERVQTALNHQIPDRVPTALWGGPYGLVDELYFRLLQEFRLDKPTGPRYAIDQPDRFLGDFGQAWIQSYPYFSVTNGILEDSEDIEEIESNVRWPDQNNPEWTAGVAQRVQRLHEGGEYYVIARMIISHDPLMLASDLRGASKIMLDMSLNPSFAAALLTRVTESICGLLESYMKAGRGYFDMIELHGDDYATNQN